MVMSIDPLKTNLTAEEAGELLVQLTAGKTFSDGPYEYRVAVKNTDIINGLIITVTNLPDHIGPDLIKYVLTRLEVMLRNFKEANQLEFYVIKIWMDMWGHKINFQDEMEISEDLDFTFDDKDKADRAYKTIDFTEGRRRMKLGRMKLQKYVDHFNKSYSDLHASLNDINNLNTRTSKLIKEITGGVPSVKFECIAEMGFDTTIEDGEYKATFGIKVKGLIDVPTSEWIQKLADYTSGEDELHTSVENSKSELKFEFRKAVSDMIKNALSPIKHYFLHSLVHVNNIDIIINTQEGYRHLDRSYQYTF